MLELQPHWFSQPSTGIRAMTQSISEERKQTLDPADEQSLFVRQAFIYDSSGLTWLKVDCLDFLSTVDLRVALFLPREHTGNALVVKNLAKTCKTNSGRFYGTARPIDSADAVTTRGNLRNSGTMLDGSSIVPRSP